MGKRPADGVAMGHSRKRGKRATGGCVGRRERQPTRRGREAAMGQFRSKGRKNEAGGVGKEQSP